MPGKLVETPIDGKGKTIDREQLINGKVKVYLRNGKKILCDPDKLKIIGFWDKKL